VAPWRNQNHTRMSDPFKSTDGQTSAGDDKPSLPKRLHGLITTYLKPEFLSALLLLSELFGGLIFFGYVLHIGFMPEVDAAAFVTLLAAFALTGLFLLLALSFLLIAPGWAWKYTTKGEESLKSPWWFGWLALFFTLGWFLYSLLYDLHVPRWWPAIVVWVVGIALPLALLLFNKPWHWIVRFSERSAMGSERPSVAPSCASSTSPPVAAPMCPLHRKQSKGASDSARERKEKRIKAASLFFSRDWKQKGRAVRFFFKACIYCAVPLLSLYIFVMILEGNRASGLYQRHPVLLTVEATALMLAILVWNMAAIRAPTFTAVAQIAAVLMIGLFFLLQLWTSIPSGVVRILRFGDFKANLVLDETGCAIAREDHLIPATEKNKATGATPKTCSLPDVTILSRLGTSYYLRYHTTADKDSPAPKAEQVCFTIPGHDVLSWTVRPEIPDPPCQYQVGAAATR
jgi:hypothetical protein